MFPPPLMSFRRALLGAGAALAAASVALVGSVAPASSAADTTPPDTTLTRAVQQGVVTLASTATFEFTATEAATFQCRLDGSQWRACSSPRSLSSLALGVHTFEVRAIDRAGNVDPTPETRTWTRVSGTPGSVRPGPDNTGVPAGTSLKRHDGNLVITTPGTVIDSLDIHGFVVVRAPNVTIQRSIIRGGSASNHNQGLVTATTASATKLVIKDSELVPKHPSPWFDGIKGGNFTLRRVESTGTVDNVGIHMPNVVIESSWLHGARYYASSPVHRGGESHNDAVQVHGGHNIRIIGSRLEGANNAAVMVTQDYAPTSGLTISKNWLDGGGCTVNLHHKKLTSMGGITIRDNRFGRNTRVSDCAVIKTDGTSIAESGNVWSSTGSPIRIRRG